MNFSGICSSKRNIFILSRTLKNYNSSRIKAPKFIRFISSIGVCGSFFVIAGCCFSRKKEVLPIDATRTCDKTVNTTEVRTADFKSYSFDNTQKMKRNTDAITQPAASNPENESASCDFVVPQCFRSETSTAEFESDPYDNVQKMKRNTGAINHPVSSEPEKKFASCDLTLPQFKKIKTENESVTDKADSNEKSSLIRNIQVNYYSNASRNPQKKDGKHFKDANQDTDVTEPEGNQTKWTKRPVKQKPNYFVAVQISNDKIMQSLKLVQDHILQKEGKLWTSMNSLKTLHITLMVMHIGDPHTYGRAMEALQNVHDEFDNDLSQNPLHLEFQGLSHFRNRVLYAKISNPEARNRLTSLADGVRKHFAAVSLYTTDSVDRFTPHMTVAKIDFKKSHKGLKKIDPSLYEEFNNEYFGSQRVESIQLCCMTGPKNEAGYYSNKEIFFTGLSPEERLDSLQKSLSLEKKKYDVKKMINILVSDKMK